eukprot:4362870-Alexandrium_andersonii.AAC.1
MFTRHYERMHPGVAAIAFIETPWFMWLPDTARVYMHNLLVHGRPTPPRIAFCPMPSGQLCEYDGNQDLADYGHRILW